MDVLTGWVKWRIQKNKNAIIVINGPTGSGKSYAGLCLGHKLSQELGTNFSIEGNVDFSFSGLLRKSMREENRKAGTVFLFEEVGAVGGGGSSREWQSKANKFFFSFMQTTRHRNQILIFTCPMFTFLDAGARSLVHMQVMMKNIDFRKKVSYARPYVLQVNQRSGKTYFKNIRVVVQGKRRRVGVYGFSLPPSDMISEYEGMKMCYTDKLNRTILDFESEQSNICQSVTKSVKKTNNVDPLVVSKMFAKGMTAAEVCRTLGISRSTVFRYRRQVKELAKKVKESEEQRQSGVSNIRLPDHNPLIT